MKIFTRSIFIVFVSTGLLATSAKAAEISFLPHGKGLELEINGEILPGDSQKFTTLILKYPAAFLGSQQVQLNSRGGSVEEALKIADTIEKTGLITIVDDNSICASACFLIYVAGSTRLPLGPILVHRPYFDTTKIDHTQLYEYSARQQQSTLRLRTFLESRAVPSDIIDKMMSLPSNSAYELSSQDEGRIGALNPTFEEIAINNCGASNETLLQSDSATLKACLHPSVLRMQAVFLRDRLAKEDAMAAVNEFRASTKRGYFEIPNTR